MDWPHLDCLVEEALREDIGPGDVTTEVLIEEGVDTEGKIEAVAPAVVCGLPLAERVFRRLDAGAVFEAAVKEGDEVGAGEVVAVVRGGARAVLSGERCALNFLQWLSGIATLTREFVKRTAGTGVRILDTRKTTPTLRALEKYAVRVGGGANHRMGLFDGILVKNNHLALMGSVGEVVRRALARRPHNLVVQVEVGSVAEAEEAVAAGAQALLLDNMGSGEVAEVVRRVGGVVFLEASGGVGLEGVEEMARTGVNAISVGRLTHSAPAANFRLGVGGRWPEGERGRQL